MKMPSLFTHGDKLLNNLFLKKKIYHGDKSKNVLRVFMKYFSSYCLGGITKFMKLCSCPPQLLYFTFSEICLPFQTLNFFPYVQYFFSSPPANLDIEILHRKGKHGIQIKELCNLGRRSLLQNFFFILYCYCVQCRVESQRSVSKRCCCYCFY